MTDWRLTIVALLLSPDEPQAIPFADPFTWAAYKSIAADLELVSPDHVAYGLESEIRWCREQLPLVEGCPSIGHAGRMPSREACAANVVLATEFNDWLETMSLIYPHRDLYAARRETLGRQRLWSLMQDATSESNSWSYRRQAMRDVLEIVGPERFYSGCWPAPLPLHRLRTIP